MKVIETGHFYFLTEEFFQDFQDDFLMCNADRPCFYAFEDHSTGLFWIIPFTSRVEKFKNIYQHKIEKYGECDTIVFGDVLGHEKAFLIQNMCPISGKYIKNEYVDKHSHLPVRVDGPLEQELIGKARKVLRLHKKGIRLIFPDVLKMEKVLLEEQ